MAEIFRKVQPYEFNYVCDQCLRGMMQATGKVMQGGIEHQCMICSHKQLLAKSYPHVEYFAEQESSVFISHSPRNAALMPRSSR